MIGRFILYGLVAVAVIIALVNYRRITSWIGWMRDYYHEVVMEMRKVAWPTKNHIIGSTILVGVTSVILMIVIGVVDRVFGEIVGTIFSSH